MENNEQTGVIKETAEVVQGAQPLPKEYAELFEVGAHFGHEKSRVHPSMLPYIVGVRNGVHIIDIEKTLAKLTEAIAFLEHAAKEGKIVLFVGTKLPVRELVKNAAEESGAYYMADSWPGGVMTNWKTFSRTLEHLDALEEKKKSEEWNKYTKYERMMMDRELGKLNERWGGVKGIKKLPDILVITDLNHDEIAVREAHKLGIPIVAIVDTNVDVSRVAYPIPASDDSIHATAYILKALAAALVKGKKSQEAKK